VDDVVGVFEATALYSPSEIVYHLEHPVKLTRRDNSEHDVPRDMFRLRSTSAGAVIHINRLSDTYNLQDTRQLSFRLTATDQARRNASKTVLVTVTTTCLTTTTTTTTTSTTSDTYNLQDTRHLSFRLTATDQARRNTSKTVIVTVTTVTTTHTTTTTTTTALLLLSELGDITVRTLDLRSKSRQFDSRSGRHQVVSTWMSDCLWTGKQLSLPSLRDRWIKYRSVWLGLRRGTLCEVMYYSHGTAVKSAMTK